MQTMQRKLSLHQATAINMIDMVGIGPFITLPMVIAMMNGPSFLYAWLTGALLAFMDAMVWSELGSAFPLSGGSYQFLLHTYGREKGGRLMSFLFVWQTMIQAPLVIASAAIGFSEYLSFLITLTPFESKLVSGGVVILIVILLYRKIDSIGKISQVLWVGVLITLFWIIGGGLAHGNFMQPIRDINKGIVLDYSFITALGFASVKSVYSFLGYYNVCLLGGEINNPKKNIPRSMFLSITGITILYLMMNISVVSVIPWQQAKDSQFVISEFMQVLMGSTAAKIITVLILWVAFSSVFSATLGYTRIPYAAANDGQFFKVFGKLHPKNNVPYVSLFFLGGVALIFSMQLRLSEVISAILAMRILVQFIGQAVGLLILHKKKGKKFFPFNMPLYPIPAIIAIAMWTYILISTGSMLVRIALMITALGIIVYFIKARLDKTWPFGPKNQSSS
ncbi:MAG: amino acid permease [Chitinophagaceae bacterium]|nr:amino acid permease [Chitinophagaceae bacterium]